MADRQIPTVSGPPPADVPEGGVAHVAGAVADGLDIDWAAALEGAPADQRAVVEQLRLLSHISRASGPPPGIDAVRVTRHWGPFDIIEELDRGSYGRVYRARDTRVDRDVAVKLLAGGSTAEVQALLDEARALGRVSHPNVITVYGADRFDGVAGLWTEYIDGATIQQLVNEMGPAGPREAIAIVADVCAALSAVHAAGLVHRDVTARNVMRSRGGRIVLLDFGWVGATDRSSHRLLGTPLYMAPELFEGGQASVQTDVYAAGVLLYHLVTRTFPVAGQTPSELRDAHRTAKRRDVSDARPDLPPRLCRVIETALAADPARRFASAGEMRRELQSADDFVAMPAAAPRVAWYRRSVPVWAVALMLLSTALAGGLAIWRIKADTVGEEARSQLTVDQWSVLDGYHDLAETAASRGNWADARAAYHRAAEGLTTAFGEHAAQVWVEHAKAAQAGLRSGETTPATADASYARALYAIAERAGAKQPLRATLEAARATNLWEAGRRLEASHALVRAIDIRERNFRSQSAAGDRLPSLGFPPSRLDEIVAQHHPAADRDGDWIPDAIEMAAGLDPAARDSDQNGVVDEEEDTDGDGIRNGLEWGLVDRVSNTLGFEGTADPSVLLARWVGPVTSTARPTRDRLWRVSGPLLTYYGWRVPQSKQVEALTRGFRLFLRARPQRGFVFAATDWLGTGPAFAMCVTKRDDGGVTVVLPERVDLEDARRFELPPTKADAVFELTYDPETRSAIFRIDGERVATGYDGMTEMQAGGGLVFGTANSLGAVARGEGDFQLVLLQIR
jgi:hypothetical protein